MRLWVAPFRARDLAAALEMAPAAVELSRGRGEPVFVTNLVEDDALVLGSLARDLGGTVKTVVRATTGPPARVLGACLHHALALPALASLTPDATRQNFLNRTVRGFLRGYARLGAPAQYFGREYVSVAHRPCGLLGCEVAEDGAVLIELFVGLDAPALVPSLPGTVALALHEVAPGRAPAELVALIERGLASAWGLELVEQELAPSRLAPRRATTGAFVRRPVPIGGLEAWASRSGSCVRLAGDVLSARSRFDAVEARAARALRAGGPVDEEVLAPLAAGPLFGARLEDVRLVLEAAFALAT